MNDILLFKDLDTIEQTGLPYCIINNTLLSLYRDGKCFDGERRECVVLMWSSDRPKISERKDKVWETAGNSGWGNINLKDKIAINFVTEVSGKLVVNPYAENYFVFEKYVLLPYLTLTYKGRNIPIPHDPDKYLTMFYDKWRIPVPAGEWNWVNSKGIIRAQNPDEAVRIYKQNESSTSN